MRGQGFNLVSQLEAMSAVVTVGKVKNTALSDSDTLLCLTTSVTSPYHTHYMSLYSILPKIQTWHPDKVWLFWGSFHVFFPHTEKLWSIKKCCSKWILLRRSFMVDALRNMILHLHAVENECIGLENSIYWTINQFDCNRKKNLSQMCWLKLCAKFNVHVTKGKHIWIKLD